jgi:RHS repeat-associated protein
MTYVGQQLRTRTENGTLTRYFYDDDGNLDCTTTASGTAADCSPATGSTISSSLLADYSYDYRNRLAAYAAYNAGTATNTASYSYDALSRPVAEDETHAATIRKSVFSYLGVTDNLSTETRTNGSTVLTTKSYRYDAFGSRTTLTNTPGTGTAATYGYVYNPHGDVTLLINQDGTAAASYGYAAYGDGESGIASGDTDAVDPLNPYRFNGKRLDAVSGTFDMGARRFSSGSGRFLQQDIYFNPTADLELAMGALTQSRYGYAGGNPISFSETDGHMFAMMDSGPMEEPHPQPPPPPGGGTTGWKPIPLPPSTQPPGVVATLEVMATVNTGAPIAIVADPTGGHVSIDSPVGDVNIPLQKLAKGAVILSMGLQQAVYQNYGFGRGDVSVSCDYDAEWKWKGRTKSNNPKVESACDATAGINVGADHISVDYELHGPVMVATTVFSDISIPSAVDGKIATADIGFRLSIGPEKVDDPWRPPPLPVPTAEQLREWAWYATLAAAVAILGKGTVQQGHGR